MTSPLQQAFLDDDPIVVLRKVQQGSYPLALYKKALKANAFKCVEHLVSSYGAALDGLDWKILSEIEDIDIPAALVIAMHIEGGLNKPHRQWLQSAVRWEKRGVVFPLEFYASCWETGINYQIRMCVFQLAICRRFDVCSHWLKNSNNPEEISKMSKQLWRHSIQNSDTQMLEWLGMNEDKGQLMMYLYDAIWCQGLHRPRSSLKLKIYPGPNWTIDDFFDHALNILFKDLDTFFMYFGLYQENTRRHLWAIFETSLRVPDHWRAILSGNEPVGVHGNELQRLLLIFHSMYPSDQTARMLAYTNTLNEFNRNHLDLIDLL